MNYRYSRIPVTQVPLMNESALRTEIAYAKAAKERGASHSSSGGFAGSKREFCEES
jgi:hypothetical protein